jgi:hypothetical protein
MYYLIGYLTTYYIPFLVIIYKSIFPPNDISTKTFYTLNEYFLRELDKSYYDTNNTNNTSNTNNSNNKVIMPCCGVIKDMGLIENNTLLMKIKGQNIFLNTNYKQYINICS